MARAPAKPSSNTEIRRQERRRRERLRRQEVEERPQPAGGGASLPWCIAGWTGTGSTGMDELGSDFFWAHFGEITASQGTWSLVNYPSVHATNLHLLQVPDTGLYAVSFDAGDASFTFASAVSHVGVTEALMAVNTGTGVWSVSSRRSGAVHEVAPSDTSFTKSLDFTTLLRLSAGDKVGYRVQAQGRLNGGSVVNCTSVLQQIEANNGEARLTLARVG